MAEVLAQLEADKFYHIYNHAVGSELFFESDTDYMYFLKKLNKYILPIADVYAYCLMPNHFHLVVRIKEDLNKAETATDTAAQVSQAFANLFNAYAKWYNYTKGRKGTLFARAFRRKWIEDSSCLQTVIIYAHQNPVKAGFAITCSAWRYSSYNAILGKGPTMLKRTDVIALFDDIDNFSFCHSKQANIDE